MTTAAPRTAPFRAAPRATRRALALVGASLLLAPSAIADEIRVSGHILPLENELLPQPITLSAPCDQVTIVEWKPTAGAAASTGDSPLARKEIDRLCRRAFAKFGPFLRARRYTLPKSVRLLADVSLLPAHLDRGGTSYRNLNDLRYRFARRTVELDAEGSPIPIWGYFARVPNHVFIRNDVLVADGSKLNPEFAEHFAHELFHAMSWQTGFFEQQLGVREETWAAIFGKLIDVPDERK